MAKVNRSRVEMHDGSRIVLRKLDKDYDPTHRGKAFNYLRAKLREGKHVTGLIYVASGGPDMHAMAETSEQPLNAIPYEKMHPGRRGARKGPQALRLTGAGAPVGAGAGATTVTWFGSIGLRPLARGLVHGLQ